MWFVDMLVNKYYEAQKKRLLSLLQEPYSYMKKSDVICGSQID